jgi:hypothetical protein
MGDLRPRLGVLFAGLTTLVRPATAPDCGGGSFSNGAYDKNVVVYAVPVQ